MPDVLPPRPSLSFQLESVQTETGTSWKISCGTESGESVFLQQPDDACLIVGIVLASRGKNADEHRPRVSQIPIPGTHARTTSSFKMIKDNQLLFALVDSPLKIPSE